MTLENFVKKYDNKFLEVAGSSNALNQCVDAANGYIKEVLGLPIIEWTNAKDFPSKAGDNYDYIKNTPTGVPEKGDLIVWGPGAGGGYGHIAVYLEGGVNSFKSFDQNWPTGTPCHIQGHYYNNVIGWLRPRITETEDEEYYQGLDLNNKESMKIAVDVWARLRDGKLIEAEEFVKTQKENLNLKPKAEKWEAVCKTYDVKSIEELTRIIDEGQSSTPCENLLIEKDKECVKKVKDLQDQHDLKVELLKKQLVNIDTLTLREFLAYKLSKFIASVRKNGSGEAEGGELHGSKQEI